MKFDDNVISSREALSLEKLPDHVVVVGGGYIGLELGITYRMLGSEVTIVEAMDSILPIFDKELRRPLNCLSKRTKSRFIPVFLPRVLNLLKMAEPNFST